MCPNAIKTGMPLGSEEFVVEMEKKLERRLLQRPKGRPRKEYSKNGMCPCFLHITAIESEFMSLKSRMDRLEAQQI
jgi:hypothetical protein